MRFIERELAKDEIEDIRKEHGNYVKVTADIEGNRLVAGCLLHADGEEILLERGARQNNIWGGGINFISKEVDTTAVLNLRPNLGNNGLEILDNQRREKFLSVVKYIFRPLWES